ncbi:MAG: hypothetical protein M3Y21_12460 [Candidatus Eremiobacteraeota bacterium]|nr:hypothetical protein [Candidatus Eremiobacteraeota bacterium]
MNKIVVQFTGVMAIALLAACGGGAPVGIGGGGTPPTNPPSATPCPSGYTGTPLNCVAPPSQASVTGKLVDYDSQMPLAGEPVSIAAGSVGCAETSVNYQQPVSTCTVPNGGGIAPSALAPYVAVATTAPDGSFAFTASPGPYLMRIGSESPTDTRATIHDAILLKGGPNPLAAPTMPPQPGCTDCVIGGGNLPGTVNPPIQSSGLYRLATLTPVEEECLNANIKDRAAIGLGTLIPDEWLVENNRDTYSEQVATNTLGQGSEALTIHNYVFGGGSTTCTDYIATSFRTPGTTSALNSFADPQAIWYGGAFGAYPFGNGINHVGTEEWLHDPRTETSADPLYLGWP